MPRYSVYDAPNSAFFYRCDLLEWRRRLLGLTLEEVAQRTGLKIATIYRVFNGDATGKKVYPVARVLNLDWSQVHNLELKESEFHLAVINGNGSHLAG